MNITEQLQLKLPLFQAPLIGYPNQEHWVAEVCNGGALGVYSTPLQTLPEINETLERIQQQTDQPFAVLIDVTDTDNNIDLADQSQANNNLKSAYQALEIDLKKTPQLPSTSEITALVINKKPAAIIFANGLPSDAVCDACREKAIMTIALASNTLEALVADKVADAIILQGCESAGMQSRFPNDLLTSTFPGNTLLQHTIAHTNKPLIIWADAQSPQHVVSALISGASCVVIDTPFWTTSDAPIPNAYRQALRTQHNEMLTTLARVWLGQDARVLRNQLTELAENSHILPAKKQQRLMLPVIRAAIHQDNPQFMPLWAGFCATVSDQTTAELCETFLREVNEIIT